MIDPTPQIRKLAEAELFRAELEARRLARKLSLVGIAVFIALFALTMLVIAGFLALSEIYGYPLGALITGGVLAVPPKSPAAPTASKWNSPTPPFSRRAPK